jgi:hypothetical protein
LEVGLSDDSALLRAFSIASGTAAAWRHAGVNVVRVEAHWRYIAPAPNSPRRPRRFHPDNPRDRGYDWTGPDQEITVARAHGMQVMLALTGGAPLWATGDPRRRDPVWRPDPHQYALFVRAAVLRYRDLVPRFLIWNEPNQPGWLRPQSSCSHRRCEPVAPHLYRSLVRAAYPVIKALAPHSQALIGTLASRGRDAVTASAPLRPLLFLRTMACVDSRYRPLRSRWCRGFAPAPGDGFAYHPYGVLNAPDQPSSSPDEARIADLGRLERVLDRLTSAHRLRSSTRRFQLFLTEFGYRTDPPDPHNGVSLDRQALWLAQSAYIAWRDPRVRNLTQYEWRDEARSGHGRRVYGWQSGLLFVSGRAKPALASFRAPFFIDHRHGSRYAVFWGQARVGPGQSVTLWRRTPGSPHFVRQQSLRPDPLGYWIRRLPWAPRTAYRFTYRTSLSPARRGAMVTSPERIG